MNNIILTTNEAAGQHLKDAIVELRPDVVINGVYTKETLVTSQQMLRTVDCVFSTWDMPVYCTEEIQRLFPNLKAIFYAAGTTKYFVLPFLQQGIRVFSSAKVNGIPVAEFVVAQIVLANKGYFQSCRAYQPVLWWRNFWRARRKAESKSGNYHSRIGVVGCGFVGSAVIRLLKSYELEVVVYDPYLSEERANMLGVKIVTLEELFSTCDVVSNHLPNTVETQGLIDYRLFSMMKPMATFINTGRGAQVNEYDLCHVLKQRKQMCALLDVTRHEPPYPWSSLLRLKNVFLTPHIAGSMGDEKKRLVNFALQAYDDFLADRQNDGEVKIEQWERMA